MYIGSMQNSEVRLIKTGSVKKLMLQYMKMKSAPVTTDQVCKFVEHRQQRPSRIHSYLLTLKALGFVDQLGPEEWCITKYGVDAVYTMGKRDKRSGSEDD